MLAICILKLFTDAAQFTKARGTTHNGGQTAHQAAAQFIKAV
jgi:hypothetical protein